MQYLKIKNNKLSLSGPDSQAISTDHSPRGVAAHSRDARHQLLIIGQEEQYLTVEIQRLKFLIIAQEEQYQRKHTKEKQYPSDVCGKKFTHKLIFQCT